jgi:hypothetical protein
MHLSDRFKLQVTHPRFISFHVGQVATHSVVTDALRWMQVPLEVQKEAHLLEHMHTQVRNSLETNGALSRTAGTLSGWHAASSLYLESDEYSLCHAIADRGRLHHT